VDLSKAFDSVYHPALISDLVQIGCGSSTVRWFQSYLEQRSQRVIQGDDRSIWSEVCRGVPQGSGLSPLLFNLYVRGLPAACAPSDAMQFADDLTTSKASKNIEDVSSHLSSSYNNIKKFCEERHLVVNPAKTQFIVFKSHMRKLPSDFHITVDNISLQPEEKVKLLGVTLDRHLTMAAHIDSNVKKTQGLVNMLAKASHSLTHDLMRLAYTALIRTHLEDASGVLDMASASQLHKLDLVQKAAVRVIAGVPRLTHSEPLFAQYDIPPLGVRRSDHVLNLIEKILNGKCHPSLRDLFKKTEDSNLLNLGLSPRTGMGKKAFHYRGVMKYNNEI